VYVKVPKHKQEEAAYREWVRRAPGLWSHQLRAIEEKRARQKVWLEAFIETGSINFACKAVGRTRAAYLAWRKKDPWFQEQYNQAVDLLRHQVLDSVLCRAIGERPYGPDGRPLVDAEGKPVYKNASDYLAEQLLGGGADSERGTVVIDIVCRTREPAPVEIAALPAPDPEQDPEPGPEAPEREPD